MKKKIFFGAFSIILATQLIGISSIRNVNDSDINLSKSNSLQISEPSIPESYASMIYFNVSDVTQNSATLNYEFITRNAKVDNLTIYDTTNNDMIGDPYSIFSEEPVYQTALSIASNPQAETHRDSYKLTNLNKETKYEYAIVLSVTNSATRESITIVDYSFTSVSTYSDEVATTSQKSNNGVVIALSVLLGILFLSTIGSGIYLIQVKRNSK